MEELQENEKSEKELAFSRACVALLKGVVDRWRDENLWQDILNSQAALKDYLAKIGLRLYLDELDGYAYLRQAEDDDIPRLVRRSPLSYGLSILLVQLRKKMGEFDASNGDQKLIVSVEEMRRDLAVFLPAITNEEQYQKRFAKFLTQAEEMGVLKKTSEDGEYEVRPILRSFVNAEWLRMFEERLQEYKEYGLNLGGSDETEEAEEQEEKEETEDGLIFHE